MRVFASCTNFRKPGECCMANPPKKSKRLRVAEAEGNTKEQEEQGKRRHTTENAARPLAATKIETLHDRFRHDVFGAPHTEDSHGAFSDTAQRPHHGEHSRSRSHP